MNNSRNSTLEILRIISMIMVIGLHYMNKTIGEIFSCEISKRNTNFDKNKNINLNNLEYNF